MNNLGPFPKFTSGPAKQLAQINFPLFIGVSLLTSISIVSVSHAWGYLGYLFKI